MVLSQNIEAAFLLRQHQFERGKSKKRNLGQIKVNLV